MAIVKAVGPDGRVHELTAKAFAVLSAQNSGWKLADKADKAPKPKAK